MVLPKSMSALLHIATFAVSASAAKLAFNSPFFNKVAASGYSYFNIGERVNIAWDTDFDSTTLVVFQEVNGNTHYNILTSANGPNNRSFTWEARAIDSAALVGAQFHFFLQNADDYTCDGCYVNSRVFQLYPTGAVGGATTRDRPTTTRTTMAGTVFPSTTTSGSEPTGASGGGSEDGGDNGGDSAEAAGSNDSPSEDDNGSSMNLSVPLGVGLGAGIPVLLALFGILFMFCHHRRKQRSKEDAAKEAAFDDGTGSSTPQMHQVEDNRYSRESGALGPWIQNPSPTWEQQKQWEQEQWEQQQDQQQQQRSARHSSQKYDYIPFQPSMATHSEASRESSRHSWIDQFDFERPGYRNDDELSEVRKSIHEAPSERPKYATSAYSFHASIGDVNEIPQVPQPVHQPPLPDDNWPLR